MKVKLLLTFALLLTAVTGAWADDDSGSCGTVSYSYVESTHTLTISGTGAMADYENPSERPWNSYVEEIETVIIEDGVTRIGNYAFNYCTSLTSVTIPASVTSIGDYAFYDCSGLTSVTIPASVTTIGDAAFFNCSGLTAVTIPSSVTTIGVEAFSYCSNIATMTVEDGNTKYDSRNGCNAIIEQESNTLIAGCKNTIIPDDVTNIDNNAFEGCSGLTTITIPASVKSIGSYAFENCYSLTTVTIPASVTSIGVNAFYYCESLTSVIVHAPNCALGDYAFDECDNLEAIYVPSDKVEYYKAAENWSTYADKITAFIGGDCGAEGHETDVTWLLKGTSPNYTLTISGTGAMADYDAPSGQPWKDYRSSITSVVIESGVTSIGKKCLQQLYWSDISHC